MVTDVQDLSLYKHIDCLASEAGNGVQREDVSDHRLISLFCADGGKLFVKVHVNSTVFQPQRESKNLPLESKTEESGPRLLTPLPLPRTVVLRVCPTMPDVPHSGCSRFPMTLSDYKYFKGTH